MVGFQSVELILLAHIVGNAVDTTACHVGERPVFSVGYGRLGPWLWFQERQRPGIAQGLFDNFYIYLAAFWPDWAMATAGFLNSPGSRQLSHDRRGNEPVEHQLRREYLDARKRHAY